MQTCCFCQSDDIPDAATHCRHCGRKLKPINWGRVVGIVALIFIIGIVVFVVLFTASERDRQISWAREQPAHLMRTLATALTTYQATYEAYPDALVDLGSSKCAAFSGPHCAGLLADFETSGHVWDYTFTYTPGHAGHSRVVSLYRVVAVPDRWSEGARSYYLDQTGIVRYTTERRPATDQDPPVLDIPGV